MDMSRKLTWSVLILAALLAAGAVVLALTLGTARGEPEATPQTTVRDFLGAAVVDNDGGAACAYLTARGTRERRAPRIRPQLHDVLRLGPV
jgi:hypothetical protein